MKGYQLTQLPVQLLSEALRSLTVQTEVAKRAELGQRQIIPWDRLIFQPPELSVKLIGYFEGEPFTRWYDAILFILHLANTNYRANLTMSSRKLIMLNSFLPTLVIALRNLSNKWSNTLDF